MNLKLFMKYVFFSVIAILLASCGSGSSANANNVSGNWTAALANTTGQTEFSFTVTLSQAADNSITGTNVKFTAGAPCFQNVSSDIGQITINGTGNGVTANTVRMSILGSEPGEIDFNTLTLQGTDNGSTISGAWVMRGPASGCTASGNFVMTKS